MNVRYYPVQVDTNSSAITADDRIHESVPASNDDATGWSPEEFDGWQDAPTD